MNCSIDSFQNTFFDLRIGDSNVIDITFYGKRQNVINWVTKANSVVVEQGFNKPLFNVENYMGADLVHILRKNHIEYQSYIENVVKPDLRDKAEFSSELEFEEIRVVNEQESNNHYEEIVITDNVSTEEVNTNDVNDNNYNFNEWINTRQTLLRDLSRYKERLVKTKGGKEKIEKTAKLIEYIRKELETYDTSSLDSLYKNIKKEVDLLNKLLEHLKEDPVASANLLEVHNVKKRIDELKKITKAENQTRKVLSNNQQYEENLITQINDLENNYNNSLEDLLFSIISNDELMLEHKKNAEESGNTEKFDKVLQRIRDLLDNENKIYSVDGASDVISGKRFLGAESYNSVLSELVIITQNNNQFKEAGITSVWKKKFENAYKKITSLKINGKPINDLLFMKDEFGVNTQRLINPFTAEFFSEVKKANIFKKLFYNNTESKTNRAKAYYNWMKNLKDNTDYLEVYKIQSFVEKFRGKEDFDSYFDKYSEVERSVYEQEMRKKLGNTTFEMLLEKQTEQVETYMYDYIDANKRTYSNPLYFISKFYSENFINEVENLSRNNYSFDTNYIFPTYTYSLPKTNKNSFFNQEFINLENNINSQTGENTTFSDFYVNAKNLLDYSNNTFYTEGIDVRINDVISLRDASSREVLKNLNLFKKIGKGIYNLLIDLFAKFYKVKFENALNKEDYNPNTDRKFNTGYNSYGERELNEIKKLLKNKSIEELIEIAKKDGLTINDNMLFNKNRLIEVITRNRINDYVSLDLFKRVMYGVEIAQSINIRRNTEGVLSIVNDYIDNIGDNAKNVKEFLDIWEAQNIKKVGVLDNKTSIWAKGERWRVLGKNTWLEKKLTRFNEVEKHLKTLLEEEKKRIHEDFNFVYKDHKYKFNNKKQTFEKTNLNTKEVFVIEKNDIQDVYYEYLDDKINNLGTKLTLGSLGYGLSTAMFYAHLAWSYISGVKNRIAGYNQNNQAAASGLHGFNQDDLTRTRRLLRGANTMKYTKKVGVYHKHRMEQIEILRHIASQLGLLENMMLNLTADENNQVLISERRIEKFNELITDFPLNNPEFKNQMEIFIATLMNMDITDKNGNKHKMYDYKTMSFVFDPVTMQLKEQFRTESNIANWESFTKDNEGNSPQNLLIQKFNSVKHKLHGNYNNNDKIAMQSSVTGKSLSTFVKWFYENLNNQYGGKKVSLTRGEIDVVGRKIPMLDNKYLKNSYIVVTNLGLVTSLLVGVGFSPFTLAGLGLIGGHIAFQRYIMKKKIKEQGIVVTSSKNDLLETLSFYKEAGLRSIKTILSSAFIDTSNILSEEKVKRWTYEKEHREARALLSESTQELADYVNMYFWSLSIEVALIMIFKALKFNDDDDEKKLEYEIEQLGLILNKTTNVRNELLSEIQMWGNLLILKDMATPTVFESFIKKTYDRIAGSHERYEKGEISKKEMYYEQFWGLSNLIGTPSVVFKTFHPNEDVSSYKDKRVYDNEKSLFDFKDNITDRLLFTKEQREEMEYKGLTTRDRAKFKRIGEGKLLDAGVPKYQIPLILNSILKKTHKPKNATYKNLYENIDWDIIESYIDVYILEMNNNTNNVNNNNNNELEIDNSDNSPIIN